MAISALRSGWEGEGRTARVGDETLAWSILASLPGASVVAFDRDLRVIACAGEGLASHGRERATMLGRRLPEILGPAAFALSADHYTRAVAGEASSLEARSADQERLYVTDFSCLREPDGSIGGGVAVSRDVTQERAAQPAVAVSERLRRERADESADVQARLDSERRQNEDYRRRWERTFESTTRGICISDATTDLIESVNPAFARMHGRAAADFVGQPLRVLLPEDKQAQLPHTLSSIDGEDFVRLESEHVRHDGSVFAVMVEVLLTRDPLGRALSRIQWYDDLTEQRAAEAARREATETYETAFNNAPMGVAMIGFDGRILRANAALCEMLGRDETELVGSTTQAYTHPDDLAVTAEAFAHHNTQGTPLSVQKRYLRPDGEVVWAQTRGTAVSDGSGARSHIVSHFLDITAVKVAEVSRAEATTRFETAFADAPIGMAIVGLDGRLVRVNRVLCQLSGRTEAGLLQLTVEDLMEPEDRAVNAEHVRRLFTGQTDRYTVQQRFANAHGRLVWTTLAVSLVRDSERRPLYFISQIEDISERKRLEAELQHQADHDSLTKLWNRRRFSEELERQVGRCRRYAEHAALVLIDLDGFKQINDTYGHHVGDDLLVAVADAVAKRSRLTDSVFRLGGDEFAVILTDVSLAQADRIAASIRQTISRARITVNGVELSVNASFGIAGLDRNAVSDQQAFVQADEAMYRDKARLRLAE
jgi:diguanylate cyclase (GGDEF)-like protein/PAS domain S-box-containing protein